MTQFEKTFNLIKKPWFVGVYIVLLILVYILADKPIALYFYHLNLRINVPWLMVLTTLGKWQMYFVLFLFAALFFRYVKYNHVYEIRCWYLFGGVFIPNVLGLILKFWLSRARPELLFTNHAFGFYWFQLKELYWSLPSGHAITAGCLAAALGIIFPRYFYELLVLALIIAMTRVVLYYHYLSDILAGLYFGLLVIGFWTKYLKKQGYLEKLSVTA